MFPFYYLFPSPMTLELLQSIIAVSGIIPLILIMKRHSIGRGVMIFFALIYIFFPGFAGGCFWCMVQPFDTLPGIESVVAGYTGGHVAFPTYEEVKSGKNGHTEAVKITFDPSLMSYEQLLGYYWQVTDPTDAMGQFQDRGDNYRPVIFYNSPAKKAAAEKSKVELAASGRFDQPIVTKIEKAGPFYVAA